MPVTTIPRSILVAVVAVAVIYLTMNVCITSVVPWREAMHSKFIVSEYIERLSGPWGGRIITGLICWTSFACVFVLLLSYSRIPYAAVRDGFFFPVFARLHPRGDFPHVSLLLLGAITMGRSFFDLDAVIKALLSTRILVQFVANKSARWRCCAEKRRTPSPSACSGIRFPASSPWPAGSSFSPPRAASTSSAVWPRLPRASRPSACGRDGPPRPASANNPFHSSGACRIAPGGT